MFPIWEDKRGGHGFKMKMGAYCRDLGGKDIKKEGRGSTQRSDEGLLPAGRPSY